MDHRMKLTVIKNRYFESAKKLFKKKTQQNTKEHEGDSDTPHSGSTWNYHKETGKQTWRAGNQWKDCDLENNTTEIFWNTESGRTEDSCFHLDSIQSHKNLGKY